MMRVISGKAKGRKLKRVPGDTTRPIMDRVKENLFNLLGTADVVGARWLDLFAGTGQVGIEALSRGAAEVVFVDNARQAVRTVQENLATTGLAKGAKVVQANAFSYLQRTDAERFDLIYVAPPQYLGLWQEVMVALDKRPFALLKPDGLVVVQIDPKEYEVLALTHFEVFDERKYGNTLLVFYELKRGGDSVIG
ncbi:MAG: 16S rRNA (guanine(966)-N(2))-methyltransferase RsmD [Candidatus Promineifilaceae bacterium]